MTSYKQKYIELKQELDDSRIDRKITNHTKGYIHISWAGIGRFLALLGSAALAVLNFILIISTWEMLKLENLDELYITGFHQLLILYPLIGEYILIALTIICFVALLKGGFSKLKSFEEEGIIYSFIISLIISFIISLIISLIFGLIFGLIISLIEEFD
jgi:hypothetical protein